MPAAAPGEKTVATSRVTCHQHRGQGFIGLWVAGDIGAAPGQQLQQRLVVAAVGENYRLAGLHGRGLSMGLGWGTSSPVCHSSKTCRTGSCVATRIGDT